MNEPNINIGILSASEIKFDLYGDYNLANISKKQSGIFTASIDNDRIKIVKDGKEVVSANEIFFTPDDIEIESFLLRDVTIGKQFHWEQKENQRFRGVLKIIKEKNLLTAINILPLEEYLVSVVSSEMSPNCSPELLKAHAIVSRGWIMAQIDKRNQQKKKKPESRKITDTEIIRWYDREEHVNYDFCADDHCQRYQGVTKIINDNALNAVESTRGLALVYDNKICDTRYSKCCGGMTESFENVWEPVKHHYLSPIVDYKFELDGVDFDLTNDKTTERWIKNSPHAYCNTNDMKILSQVLVDFDIPTNNFFRWTIEYSQEELSNVIKEKSEIDFGNIKDLVPLQRGYSGRIIRLKIIGDKKELIIGKELEIRKTLSTTHLYSSAFFVEKCEIVNGIPQKFIFHGAGWGHGVGLCQIGAAVMGEKGYKFDEILIHYFNGAKIQKIYA